MIPPVLLQLRIGERGRCLYIPLFLLWPFAIVIAPIAMVGCVIWAAVARRPQLLWAGLKVHNLVCSLRGLRIDVKDGKNSIFISIK